MIHYVATRLGLLYFATMVRIDGDTLGIESRFRYVSDLISTLFDAQETRQIVREQCLSAIRHLPSALADFLSKSIYYYGGKCMAFPAVWFVGQSLCLDAQDLRGLVQKRHAALFFSLTTSIADDLVDRDEVVGVDALLAMYCFIIDILKTPSMNSERWVWAEKELLTPVMLHMMNETVDGPLCLREIRRMEGLAVKRIGNLHRLIARQLLEEQTLVDVEAVVEGAGRFGDWCCRMDDIIDFKKDVESRKYASLPVIRLIQSLGEKAVIDQSEINTLKDGYPRLLQECVEVQMNELQQIAEYVERLGIYNTGNQLRKGSEKLVKILNDGRLAF